MKKVQKRLKFLIAIFLLVLLIENTCLAAINPDDWEKSLNAYASGSKTAIYSSRNGTSATIGGKTTVNTSCSINEDTIKLGEMEYKYEFSEADNTLLIYTTIDVKKEDTNYSEKLIVPVMFPVIFVSVTDLYSVTSNKSLGYYMEYNPTKTKMIPSGVDISNGVSYLKWLSTTEVFDTVDTDVFSYYKGIVKNEDTEFIYTDNLKINLSKVGEIEKANLENINKPVEQVNENQNNGKMPKTGVDDIVLILIFAIIAVALIFYIKFEKIGF